MIDKKNLLNYFLGLWEKAANAFLALDPELLEELSQFSGKCIQVDLKSTGITFYMVFVECNIRLQAAYAGDVDVKLMASPLSLAKLALTQGRSTEDFQVSVGMEGDIAFAQKIRSVMGRMDVDWEEILAKLFGDIVAHKIGFITLKGRRVCSDQSALLVETVSEYLVEESQMLVGLHEVNHYLESVDTLRNDVERCQIRLQQLSHKWASKSC